MKVESRASAKGIGFTGALAIAFIVLKLTGVITWSWLWVLAPIWIPIIFVLMLLLALLITAGVDKLNKVRRKRKKK